MTETSFARFPTIFAKLTGRNGVTREFRSLIDGGSDYCILPKVDAYTLGYTDAIEDYRTAPEKTCTFAAHDGYGQAVPLKMAKVDLGQLSFNDIEFLAFDVPQVTGFDVVLGASLLKFLKLRIDYFSKRIEVERGGLN